jgi:uncharacterized protein YhfF
MTEKEFLKQYFDFAGISEVDAPEIKSDKFGDSPELADDLLTLVLSGVKTATCSSVWEWEAEGEEIPKVGMLSLILDGANNPKCIIETTEITIRKYNEVDEMFASEEGEGDRSLEYWREAHKGYFSRVLPKIGREFSEDMPLVCERFRVVYK